MDAVADWASMLSLGEQQRLAFARVVLAKVGSRVPVCVGGAVCGRGEGEDWWGRGGGHAAVRRGRQCGARIPALCCPTHPYLAPLSSCLLPVQPRLVLMDESTSALDTRNERLLYQALKAASACCWGWGGGGGANCTCAYAVPIVVSWCCLLTASRLPARAAGVTYVSVGHRPTLTAFHDSVLLLHGRYDCLGACPVALLCLQHLLLPARALPASMFCSQRGRRSARTHHRPHPCLPRSSSGLDSSDAAPGGWEVRPAKDMTLQKALDYMG